MSPPSALCRQAAKRLYDGRESLEHEPYFGACYSKHKYVKHGKKQGELPNQAQEACKRARPYIRVAPDFFFKSFDGQCLYNENICSRLRVVTAMNNVAICYHFVRS